MRWVAGVILAVVCTMGMAQNPGDAQVRARFERVANSYTANNAFMGAVLVTNGDQILLDKGFGMAVLEWKVPDTPDTKFRLCSLTKQFTAALILLMQQDGKLNINDPVSKYVPDALRRGRSIDNAQFFLLHVEPQARVLNECIIANARFDQ
jgi:CubicO group peptidase (beta-lactamase class C family)